MFQHDHRQATHLELILAGEVHLYNKNRYVYASIVLENTRKFSARLAWDKCIHNEAVKVYFKVLIHNVSGITEVNHEHCCIVILPAEIQIGNPNDEPEVLLTSTPQCSAV